MNKQHPNAKAVSVQKFRSRLDIYWQSLAVYAVALVLYSLLKGVISAGRFSMAVYDPMVLLLFAFVILSAAALTVRWYLRSAIIVSNENITLNSRLRQRIFPLSNITRIAFSQGGRSRLARYRVIKIKVTGRRRTIRIRPSLFENSRDLMATIAELKRQVSKS